MIWLDENCRSVLVADDHDDIRLYLRALMESLGCTVSEARDGQEAIEIVSQECPDLILVDLNMPKMDGLAATETIRKIEGQCEHVPIIALTAHDTYA
jgi:CheY-like chemotaxis protein